MEDLQIEEFLGYTSIEKENNDDLFLELENLNIEEVDDILNTRYQNNINELSKVFFDDEKDELTLKEIKGTFTKVIIDEDEKVRNINEYLEEKKKLKNIE